MKTLAALILAQSLDTGTSCVAFQRGLHEGNPLLPNNCVVVSASKALLVATLWGATQEKPRTRKALAWIATGIGASAAAWNIHQLRRTR